MDTQTCSSHTQCAYTHSHPIELLCQHMLEIPQQVWGLFSLHRVTSSQSYIADPKQTPHKVSPIIVYNPRIHPVALWLLRCVVFVYSFTYSFVCLWQGLSIALAFLKFTIWARLASNSKRFICLRLLILGLKVWATKPGLLLFWWLEFAHILSCDNMADELVIVQSTQQVEAERARKNSRLQELAP